MTTRTHLPVDERLQVPAHRRPPPRHDLGRAFRRWRPGVGLSPTGLRVFLGILVVVQVAKSSPLGGPLNAQTIWVYSQSAWYVDYRYGFVRRGLGGQLTGQSDVAVHAALLATWIVPLVAIVILLELLVRNWTRASIFLALLIACSPAVVAELVYGRRSDQFGLAIVILVGICCLLRDGGCCRPRRDSG